MKNKSHTVGEKCFWHSVQGTIILITIIIFIFVFIFIFQVLQEDLEQEQVRVNSLTHMVVVVDESGGDQATAALEEQLKVRLFFFNTLMLLFKIINCNSENI